MKKILLALCTVVVLINFVHAQAPLVKKGTKLTYHVVNSNGKEYDYIVTVNSFGPAISFNWRMTAPVNAGGKVSVTADALQKAVAYKNYFSDASDEKLTGQSTVWLSRKNFNELKTASRTTMDMTGKMLEYEKSTIDVTASYKMKGVEKKAGIISGQYKQAGDIIFAVNVFNDPKNPLIQYMSLEDFNITLVSVD